MSGQEYHARSFPAPVYARHILEPGFEAALAQLFEPMMQANKAHVVMLVERGIVDRERGACLLEAIAATAAEGTAAYRYDPAVEDLFFAVERRIVELAGEDAGGNLQLARSRNDLDAAMCRLALRERLLDLAAGTVALRERLAALANKHVETLMPGVTHTQEAQPTTLAHYLLGVLGPLERDGERLQLAYRHVNRSPLGAAAFTTTGLPVDRGRVAALLAFDGLVENGYDAVGGADFMLEAVAALRISAASLVRFVNDLLIWARSDVGMACVGDEFIQISSIMPQKRNPVVLEHIRARTGYVFGDAATVETMVHGAAFGDTVDVEDDIYVPLFRCCDSAAGMYELLAAVLATIQFDRDRLASAAQAGFGASTELAERLAADLGLPFRQAHAAVARMVRELSASGHDLRALTPEQLAAAVEAISGRRTSITVELLASSTDAARFVARRAVPGGPAPAAVRAALAGEGERRSALAGWLDEQRTALARARETLDRRVEELSRAG